MNRLRRDFLSVAALIAGVALLTKLSLGWSSSTTPLGPNVLNIRGVALGASAAEVQRRLGSPSVSGGTGEGQGCGYYFGLTVAQESLSMTFGPGERVREVEGERLSRGSDEIAVAGDPEQRLIDALGSPSARERVWPDGKDIKAIRCVWEKVNLTVVFTDHGALNFQLEKKDQPRTLPSGR